MKISLIIPIKNEAGAIGRVLKEIPEHIVNEIIIIDGNSIDNTAAEVKAALSDGKYKYLMQTGNGFGNAVLQGCRMAQGDVVIIMNGDGSHNPKDIPALVRKVKEGYEYVLASRYAPDGRSDDDTIITFLGNKLFTSLTNLVHRTSLFDCLFFYTAITSKGLKKLQLYSPGFELCIEILIKAHRAKLSFAEVPVVERRRFAGKSKVNTFWDGFKILKMILKS